MFEIIMLIGFLYAGLCHLLPERSDSASDADTGVPCAGRKDCRRSSPHGGRSSRNSGSVKSPPQKSLSRQAP